MVGAYTGFTTGRGDCFTYYACSRALLTALGIDNLEVQRYGSSMATQHFWNLVNYGEGWYHFDTCPHLLTDPRFDCFMATDQELLNFDAGAGREYYSFDADAYPERVGGPADPNAVVPMPDRRPDPTPTPTPESTPTPAPVVTEPPAVTEAPMESAVPTASAPPAESAPPTEAVPPAEPTPTATDGAAQPTDPGTAVTPPPAEQTAPPTDAGTAPAEQEIGQQIQEAEGGNAD